MSRHHARLNARQWAAVRRAVLNLNNWRCQSCGGYGNAVDHVKSLHKGGNPYDPGNLQVLCRTCHIAKTRAENTRPDPQRDAWRAFVREMI